MNVPRIVTLRLGVSAVLLATLTGLGLFFAAGVRDAGSWSIYALATLFGIVVLVWWGRSAADAARDAPQVGDQIESSVSLSSGSAPSEVAGGRESRSELDEVDYLVALRHEFRTPLNAVLGFSDVLLSGIDGEVNESQREDLEIIRGSGIRLRILLDSALDLSQLADGDLRLDTERVDVRELVGRVAAEAGQLWSNKRTAHCLLPDRSCVTDADEARLRRSILVLAEFLATDHRDAEITLSLEPSGDHLAIEVTADPSDRLMLDALPTPSEVLQSDDPMKIRRWPVAVTSEVIARHQGALYHGDSPSRFLIRLPMRAPR